MKQGETPLALAKKPSFWDEFRQENVAPEGCDVISQANPYWFRVACDLRVTETADGGDCL